MDAKRPSGKPGKKPASKPTTRGPSPQKPGDGLFGWFGRQVGHVKKAVKTDVTAAGSESRGGSRSNGPGSAEASPKAPLGGKPKTSAAAGGISPSQTEAEKVLYRHDSVEEAELPDRPGVVLRRTIIDEVVVEVEATKSDAASRGSS